jgi:nifR3 family TIM-barrel protein
MQPQQAATFMSIRVGQLELPSDVLLAPMSGVTDAPFRRVAARYGAGLVITEMVASADLAQRRGDGWRRVSFNDDGALNVVQLAGREAYWMAQAARIAEAEGADIIDINMGCPAKQVTGSLSGSALMRDLDHALALIEATVEAVEVPVTLKMRLGWDDDTRNAPELARRAEGAGVRMLTVHGRTRCQFYEGVADWTYVAEVKKAVRIPVVVNGDITDLGSLKRALAQSKADGAMVGRGAYGRPWLPGNLGEALRGHAPAPPDLAERRIVMRAHYEDMLSAYGRDVGVRCARKHLGWYVETVHECGGALSREERLAWRKRFCREWDADVVLASIDTFHDTLDARRAA